MASSRKYIQEDKNQALVITPYGRGLVVRSQRDDGIREIQLTECELAPPTSLSNRHRQYQYAMLYTHQSYPSVQALIGDHVVCQWGRGVVQDIRREEGIVVVKLTSWRLNQRSRVLCYLHFSNVNVVRRKTLSEMDVYERVEYGEECKKRANLQFQQKDYDQALLSYSQAVEAVRYVQHDSNSSNEVRSDLLVLMITCSNNAATCSVQLRKWDQVLKFSKNALVLIEALYEQRGLRIHTLLNREDHPDSQIFGEWRVKSNLLQARAHLERHDCDLAKAALQACSTILTEYPPEQTGNNVLASQQKEAKKLLVHCEREERMIKKLEKKRAQAMFGGQLATPKPDNVAKQNSIPQSLPSPSNITKNQGGDSNREEKLIEENGFTVKNRDGKYDYQTPDDDDDATWSKHAWKNDDEEDEDEVDVNDSWFSEHKEAMILTAVVGLVALGVNALFFKKR